MPTSQESMHRLSSTSMNRLSRTRRLTNTTAHALGEGGNGFGKTKTLLEAHSVERIKVVT